MTLRILRRFVRNDSGATALEYGLLAGLISVMVIGGATVAGGAIDSIFDHIGTSLKTAQTASTTAGN